MTDPTSVQPTEVVTPSLVGELLLRPSFLDTVAHCPASASLSAGIPSISGEAAAVGSAIHAAIARQVHAGILDSENVANQEGAVRGVELEKEDAEAVEWASKWVQENLNGMVYPEASVGPGTVDILEICYADGFEVSAARIIDWKSDRKGDITSDERMQQLAYVVAVADKYEAPVVYAAIGYVHQKKMGEWTKFGLTEIKQARQMVNAVKDEAIRQASLPVPARQYRDGDWCRYCPGASKCPALEVRRNQVAGLLSAISAGAVTTIDAEAIPKAYAAVSRISEAVDDFKSIVKRTLEGVDGNIIEDETGKVRLDSRMQYPSPKYSAAIDWLKANGHAEDADRMDREITSALPPGTRIYFPKLYPKKAKKEKS